MSRLLYLKNADDTALLNNVRNVNELVLSRTSCFILRSGAVVGGGYKYFSSTVQY
jgi:hypothetical protein